MKNKNSGKPKDAKKKKENPKYEKGADETRNNNAS